MKISKKEKLFSLSGLAVLLCLMLPGSVSAITTADGGVTAITKCNIRYKKDACITAVKACGSNQTCITTALDKYRLVITPCRTQDNPQACQDDYLKKCGSATTTADKTTCMTEFKETLATATAKANDPSYNNASFSLDANATKNNQCGNMPKAEDNVKTWFNFGCKGSRAPAGTNPIIDMLYALIRFLTVGVGIVLAASIIYAGIMYASSGGNPEQTSKAKSRILNAVIALVFFLLISSLVNFLVPGGLF